MTTCLPVTLSTISLPASADSSTPNDLKGNAAVGGSVTPDDADLIEACRKWLDGRAESDRIANEATDAESSDRIPEAPAVLKEPLDLPGKDEPTFPVNERWSVYDLKLIANEGKWQVGRYQSLVDDGAQWEPVWRSVSEATRQRAAELLGLAEDYENTRKRLLAEGEKRDAIVNEVYGKQFAELKRIVETPATTIEGLRAKAEVILTPEATEIADTEPDGSDSWFALKLIENIKAIAEARA